MATHSSILRVSQVAPVVKNPPGSAGDIRDVGSIPGSGRFPGGGHGQLLQYSCLENPMDRGAWRVTVHGVKEELDMTKAISGTLCDHAREKKNKNSSQRKQKRRLKKISRNTNVQILRFHKAIKIAITRL